MKVICNRNALAEALSILAGVVGVRTTRPILQCVRLQAEKDGLTLLGTDYEQGLRYSVKEVQVQEPGETVAPAVRLAGIVHQIEGETVTLVLEDEHLVVSAPGAKFTLYTFSPDEFPPVGLGGEGRQFKSSSAVLTTVAEQTVYAAARETTRYAINGVYMQAGQNRICMVATDGRRLARASGALPGKITDEIACIVPAKAIATLEHLGGDPDASVEVTVTDSQVAFSTERALLISNLVEGQFPSYEAVIPKESSCKVTVDREKLLGAVRRVALMTSKESHSVKLTVGAEQMTMEARVPEEGEARLEIPVHVEGEGVEIAFNPDYLADPLRVLPHEQVAIEFKTSATPAVMKAGPDFLYVLMPVSTS